MEATNIRLEKENYPRATVRQSRGEYVTLKEQLDDAVATAVRANGYLRAALRREKELLERDAYPGSGYGTQDKGGD